MMNFVNTGLDESILKSFDVEHPSEELVKAMNRQGLVQKEVQVRGKNGQIFTRKQWVRASEAKSDASQSTPSQKLSPAEAKAKTKDVTSKVTDKKAFMEKAKAQGITWKENDHEGINWMRCCMAMNKHFENGGSWDSKKTVDKKTVDKTGVHSQDTITVNSGETVGVKHNRGGGKSNEFNYDTLTYGDKSLFIPPNADVEKVAKKFVVTVKNLDNDDFDPFDEIDDIVISPDRDILNESGMYDQLFVRNAHGLNNVECLETFVKTPKGWVSSQTSSIFETNEEMANYVKTRGGLSYLDLNSSGDKNVKPRSKYDDPSLTNGM